MRPERSSASAPSDTDSWWIPVELGFTLWAACPESRAGRRGGRPANGPNRDHPDWVRGRCRGPSSRCIDRAGLGWIHPAGDGHGRRVAVGLGRRFLQRAAVRPAGRRLARRARTERSHGAGFGEPLPARCRQHVAPIPTDSWWIPAELGFTLWAACPASRAGRRGPTRQRFDQRSPRLGTRHRLTERPSAPRAHSVPPLTTARSRPPRHLQPRRLCSTCRRLRHPLRHARRQPGHDRRGRGMDRNRRELVAQIFNLLLFRRVALGRASACRGRIPVAAPADSRSAIWESNSAPLQPPGPPLPIAPRGRHHFPDLNPGGSERPGAPSRRRPVRKGRWI